MEAKDLRVTDAEREHVGKLLQRAVGQGMITIAEFSERMDTAMAARTRGELNAVLVDLPGVTWRGEPGGQPGVQWPAQAGQPGGQWPAQPGQPGGQWRATPVPAPPPPPVAADGLAWITGTMSTLKRTGEWVVPAEFGLRTWFSSTKLDFTRAVLHGPVVRVHVNETCSSTTVIIPTGWTADCSNVTSFASTVEGKVRSAPEPGQPHVILDGKVTFGSLTVRHPHSEKIRKLMS